MHLLYVDLLGSAARWRRGGRDEAAAAFAEFESRADSALSQSPPGAVVAAGIESDSLVVVCGGVQEAVRLARRLYLDVFRSGLDAAGLRLWMRGVIVQYEGDPRSLRTEEGLTPHFTAYRYAAQFAEAISVERSGIKGMRLLIQDAVVSSALKKDVALPIGGLHAIPLRKLNHSNYPERLGSDYRDVVWVATVDQADWDTNKRTMEVRLRRAAADPEEFAHAAATYLLFSEWQAILGSLLRGRHGDVAGFVP
jgi:hypothetical protein